MIATRYLKHRNFIPLQDTMTQQLLMIEDDARLANMVGEYLRQGGFAFTHALRWCQWSGRAAAQRTAA